MPRLDVLFLGGLTEVSLLDEQLGLPLLYDNPKIFNVSSIFCCSLAILQSFLAFEAAFLAFYKYGECAHVDGTDTTVHNKY